MARNIEIKARVHNLDALTATARAIATSETVNIQQDDTFFRCDLGRLKLRAFVDGTGQLIFYRRAKQSGPKESFYCLSQTDCADTLRQTLSLAYGQVGRVRKLRALLNVGRTRIHLDAVEGLGDFIELEVVLQKDESAELGVAEAKDLMDRLGIQAEDLIEDAYVDLLAK